MPGTIVTFCPSRRPVGRRPWRQNHRVGHTPSTTVHGPENLRRLRFPQAVTGNSFSNGATGNTLQGAADRNGRYGGPGLFGSGKNLGNPFVDNAGASSVVNRDKVDIGLNLLERF